MSLSATEKKVRNRNDSPAPRAAVIATLCEPVCKGETSQTPSLSVVSFLAAGLLLGRAALLNDDQQSFDDGTTWTALITFLAIGAVVMHFDIFDIAKQEAAKEAGQPLEQIRTRVGWSWLFLTSLVVLLLAVAMTCLTDMPALTTSQVIDHSSVTASLSTHPDSVNTSMAVPLTREQLYSRSAKFKGMPEHVENVFGRYFDATLVRGPDFSARLPEGARRCATEEAIAVLAATPATRSHAAKARRWSASVPWSDEVSIFFLSAALAVGLATSRADVFEMSQEDQDHTMTWAAVQTPSAEKFYKPSQARGQWRLFACIALLLATAASLVASLSEDM